MSNSLQQIHFKIIRCLPDFQVPIPEYKISTEDIIPLALRPPTTIIAEIFLVKKIQILNCNRVYYLMVEITFLASSSVTRKEAQSQGIGRGRGFLRFKIVFIGSFTYSFQINFEGKTITTASVSYDMGSCPLNNNSGDNQ